MTRPLKITASVIGIIILLIIIAIILLTTLINPNSYKPQIESYVKTHTGRSLTIKGKLSWSFFPSAGFEAQNVTIGNPPNFKQPNFAKVGDMRFKISLWSVIAGDLNVKEITLKKATIYMITNTQNQTNWSNWQASPQPTKASPKQAKPEKQASTPNTTLHTDKQLSINAINIENSNVHIINRNTKNTWHFTNVNLSLKNFNSNENFPITLSYDFSQDGSANKIHTSFSAKANFDLDTGDLNIPRVEISNKVYRPHLPTYSVNLAGNLRFDPNKQVVVFRNANIDVANMNIKGHFAVTKLFMEPNIIMQFASKDTKIGTFLKTVYNTDVVSGTLNYQFQLKSHGLSSQQIMQNINGRGEFALKEGTIRYINLINILADAAQRIQNKAAPQPKTTNNETPFTSITGSFRATNGTVSNHDLVITSKSLTAKGQGVVNLKNNKINYNLNVSYQRNNQNTPSFTLPILIAGTIAHPLVQPNFEAILGNIISNKIKGLINQNTKNNKGAIGKALKGLFGR